MEEYSTTNTSIAKIMEAVFPGTYRRKKRSKNGWEFFFTGITEIWDFEPEALRVDQFFNREVREAKSISKEQ